VEGACSGTLDAVFDFHYVKRSPTLGCKVDTLRRKPGLYDFLSESLHKLHSWHHIRVRSCTYRHIERSPDRKSNQICYQQGIDALFNRGNNGLATFLVWAMGYFSMTRRTFGQRFRLSFTNLNRDSWLAI
jgi:hypothetical protein